MSNTRVRVWLRRLWPVALGAAIVAASQYAPSYELSRGSMLQRKGLEQTTLVCPIAANTATGGLIVTSPSGAADVKVATLKGRAATVTSPLTVKPFIPKTGAAVVTLGDASVASTDAVMLTRGKATLVSGLVGEQCQPPDSSWWFVGAASRYGRNDSVILTNPTTTPAQVDIEALTTRGTVHSADSRGIVVAPRSRKVVSVARLFPGVSATALHITTSNGVVHAAVFATEFAGTAGNGAEWLPATKPGLHVVPLSPDLTSATLYVAAPSGANFDVRAVGPAGVFTPLGMSGLSVAAGNVRAVPVPPVTPDAAALVVKSSAPVAVAVVGVAVHKSGTRADLVATAGVATTMQRGQAFTSVAGLSARLVVLSDPSKATRVRVSAKTAQGPWSRVLALAPGDARTLALPVTAMRAPVLLTAESGQFAAMLSLRGRLQVAADVTLAVRATTVLVRPVAQVPR